ncbi:MAG: acyltransferase family protein [Hyphomicrobium sp.]
MPKPQMLNALANAPRLGALMRPEANSFGVMRLAMALAVLVSHSYLLHFGTSSAEPLHHLTGHSLGEHAVQVFFFLSGILVAQSFVASTSMASFIAGRALRIFPGLIVCVGLTVGIIGPLMTLCTAEDYWSSTGWIAYLVRTLSLATGSAPLPGVFTTAPMADIVNMSLWTLKYEVLCYAGLAVAGVAGLFDARWRGVAIAALALFVGLIFVSSPKPIETYSTIDNIRYFALFFATGTLAFLARAHLPIHGAVAAVLFAVFVAAIGTRFGELATALFLGYATLYVATFTFGPLRRLTQRHDLSYGTYIYACPIQQALITTFPDAAPLVITVGALALVLPLAFLSWTFVERPALSWRHPIANAVNRLLIADAQPRAPSAR